MYAGSWRRMAALLNNDEPVARRRVPLEGGTTPSDRAAGPQSGSGNERRRRLRFVSDSAATLAAGRSRFRLAVHRPVHRGSPLPRVCRVGKGVPIRRPSANGRANPKLVDGRRQPRLKGLLGGDPFPVGIAIPVLKDVVPPVDAIRGPNRRNRAVGAISRRAEPPV
jgi:hypothetical protein